MHPLLIAMITIPLGITMIGYVLWTVKVAADKEAAEAAEAARNSDIVEGTVIDEQPEEKPQKLSPSYKQPFSERTTVQTMVKK
jgi:hypothetical protein